MLSRSIIKKFTVSVSFIVTSSVLLACGQEDLTQAPQSNQHTVSTYKVNLQQNQAYRTNPGRVQSTERSMISSRVMGYITKMNVQEGDFVKKGQILAQIDPVDVEGHLEIAKSHQGQAEYALKDVEKDFERFNRLYQEKAISQAQWEKMKLKYEMTQQQLRQAQAGLKIAKSQKKYTLVRSPFAGVITQKMLNQGDLTSPGHPFLVVENPRELEVITQISESVIDQVDPQANVCYQIATTRKCDLKIKDLVPISDPVSHTHFTRLSIPSNNKELKAGAFIEVLFETGQQGEIGVPKSAIVDRAGIQGVILVNSKNQAQFRMVRVEDNTPSLDSSMVKIQSGIQSGDILVVSHQTGIRNFDKLVPQGGQGE